MEPSSCATDTARGAPPSPSPSASSFSSPPAKRRKTQDPFMEFLMKESEKEERRHKEMLEKTDRFLTLFERLVEKS